MLPAFQTFTLPQLLRLGREQRLDFVGAAVQAIAIAAAVVGVGGLAYAHVYGVVGGTAAGCVRCRDAAGQSWLAVTQEWVGSASQPTS
jgi:hypothetical protein